MKEVIREYAAACGRAMRNKLREIAIECGATTEEEIAELTKWTIYVDGEKFTGHSGNKDW